VKVLAALRAFFGRRADMALEVLAPSPTVGRAQAETAQAPLSPLERGASDCAAGNGRGLASRRFPPVQAVSIPAARWPAEDQQGNSRPDSASGAGDSDWGAQKIHGDLQKLGLVVSERMVARYLRRLRRQGDPGKKWLAFLRNHRATIVAFDFFTVPTVTFPAQRHDHSLPCLGGLHHRYVWRQAA